MTRILDEKFEGTGYEESWSETVGSGCTIDEDASPSDVSSPANWGSDCLKVISAASVNNYTYSQFGDEAIAYTRIEAVFTDISAVTDDGDLSGIAHGYDNTLSNPVWRLFLAGSSGNTFLVFDPYYDGSSHYGTYTYQISANTKYRIEIEWDTTNDTWEWKIDGVSIDNDTNLTSSTQHGSIVMGNLASAYSNTGYYDLIAIDDADWVGEEPSGVVPIAMKQYKMLRS